MSTPRSKFVTDNLAKVRPKLPLYTNKKSDKIAQSKSVTMDDILRSVKTLEDTPNSVKKIERPVLFTRSDDLKKFQPCSSLDNECQPNTEYGESCVLDEDLGTESNDPKTPSKSIKNDESNDRARKSPILIPKVGFVDNPSKMSSKPVSSSEDKLFSSQNVVSFKPLLGSQSSLQTSRNNLVSKENDDSVSHVSSSKDIISEPISNNTTGGIEEDIREVDEQPNLDPLQVDQNKTVESRTVSVLPDLTNTESGPVACRNQSPSGYSQGSFDNEANAALSVFDVSDFLTCSKTKTTKRDFLSQLGAANEFRVPLMPTKFTGDIVKRTANKGSYVKYNTVEETSFAEESLHKIPADGSVSSSSSNSRSIGSVEKVLDPASNVQQSGDSGNMTPSTFKNPESGHISVSDSRPSEPRQLHNSLFTSASGKRCSISSGNLKKAALLFEACNKDSPETYRVGHIAQLDMSAQNVEDCESHSNQILDSLDIQPASSQISSQDGLANVKLSPGTGFCSAKGRNIFVSEKSLSFASNLLDDMENKSIPGGCSNELASFATHGITPRPSTSSQQQYRKCLFNTSSGKTMTISSANLQKAKILLDQCSSDLHVELPDSEPSRTKPDSSTSVGVENKSPGCNMSEESSSASETVGFRSTDTQLPHCGTTTGFSTARGQNICVSEKSLNFASQLLETLGAEEDDSHPEASNESHVSRATNTKDDHYWKNMFQSVSGKTNSISSVNLRKAKNLLDSLDSNTSEVTSASEQGKNKAFTGGEVQIITESRVECPDLCTPENAALLDNDDELFQAIETPSKGKNVLDASSSRDLKDSHSNGFVESCSNRSKELLPSPKDDLAVPLYSSPTVFNKSGIGTQKKICANSTSSPSPSNVQGTPETKALPYGLKSPVLLNGSFVGTPSPRRLQYSETPKQDGRISNSSTSSPCLTNETTSRENSPFPAQNSDTRIVTGLICTGSDQNTLSNFKSNDPRTSLMFFKASSGKTIEPSAASMSKVWSLLGDLIDEEIDSQISSYVGHNDVLNAPTGKLLVNDNHANDLSAVAGKENSDILVSGELKTCSRKPVGRAFEKLNDCVSGNPKIKETTTFKSAAGKCINASEESLKRVQALFNDVVDEEDGTKNCGNLVVADDHTNPLANKFCTRALDGSLVEKSGNFNSKAAIVGTNALNDHRSPSTALNCSSVASEKQESLIEKSPVTIVNTPVSTIKAFKEKVLSSPDWGEFPDLKSSQAALLENQGGIPKENNGLEANRQTSEWGDFPEMLNTEVCKLEQTKIYCSDSQQKERPVVQNKPVVEKHSIGFMNQKGKTELVSTSVTIERVTTQEIDQLHGSETSRKRKSMLNTPQNSRKKSKASLSPQEDSSNKLALRKNIREQQCFIVRSKSKQQIQPKPGQLFTKKERSCRWELRDLEGELKTLEADHVEVKISKTVIDITSENSVDYRFSCSRARAQTHNFIEGDIIADSCLLAYADDNTAGLKETTTAFLTCPHVDPKLIPNGWIGNHYRWIVWKLACMERTFPDQFGRSCLTLENVLLQLKYRYDREIDMVQRSCFKKLLEGDSAPKKMICCVAAVKKNNLDEGESLLELELTDGWYSIWAVIDSEMVDIFKRGVVAIGTKLIIHSAELTNCGQGCDPLNVPGNVKLKISTNSVRRVKWFAKLGFRSNNSPIPALLCSVLPNGGLIGQVTTVVARKYPVIYMCKDGDGKTVFRNERSQALFKEQQEKIKSDRAEQVYDQVWKEVESRYHKPGKSSINFSSKALQNITDPELLFDIMDGSESEFLQSQLSAHQLRLVMHYKDDIMSKMKNEVQKVLHDRLSTSEPTSKVTKLLKVRLMDLFTEKHALLTIWRPSEDDLSVLREEKAFEFFNLIASGTRDKVLQLSSTRQTSFVPNAMLELSEDCCRTVTPIRVVDTPGFAPVFGEIDVVGVVVLLKLPEQTRGVTVVYLSDLEGSFLSITFWTSLSDLRFKGHSDLPAFLASNYSLPDLDKGIFTFLTGGSVVTSKTSTGSERFRCKDIIIRVLSRQPDDDVLTSKALATCTRLASYDGLSSKVFGCEDLMAEGSVISCSNLQWRSVSNQRKIPSVFASEITSFSLNPKESHLQRSVAELKKKIVDKDVGDLVHQARTHILQTSGFRDSSSSPALSTPLRSIRGTPAHKKLKLLSRLGEDAPPLSPIPLTVTTRHVFQNFKSPCRTPSGSGKSKQS